MNIFFPIFITILLAFVGGLIIYLNNRFKRNVNHNLQLVTKILNSKIKKSIFSSVVEGYYKERKIIFRCDYSSKVRPAEMGIEPRILPKVQKKFVISFPQPTKCTSLQGKMIVYQESFIDKKRGLAGFGVLSNVLSEQDIIDILEKLTQAAKVVETNAPYFKK